MHAMGRRRPGKSGVVSGRTLRELVSSWPVLRQVKEHDGLGRGPAARSPGTAALAPRTETADAVVRSICPYCAVGCGQLVFVKDGEIVQIEGDPDSPISRGRLCPKGAATRQLVSGPLREYRVRYRAPHSRAWRALPLEQAMDMIADRVISARNDHWEDRDSEGR